MSRRTKGAIMVALCLTLFAGGCRKKGTAAAPPPPPPPKEEVKEVQRPTIARFTAEPTTIQRGDCATLRWSVQGATEVTIEPGIGVVAPEGQRQVCPTSTTTYTLTARNAGGTTTQSVTITVTSPAPPPPPPPPQPSKRTFGERLAELEDIYFDYDKSNIREDARAALSRNADRLKSILSEFSSDVVTLEGHCDERGSAEYNIGLGDRRATATKEFLVQMGISADRLKTVSYGKERPTCTESNEDCWQKNRRTHFAQ